jgi:hypothetical protein
MVALDTNVLIYACDKADPSRKPYQLPVTKWRSILSRTHTTVS